MMKRTFSHLFAFTLCLGFGQLVLAETTSGNLSINQWVHAEDGMIQGTIVLQQANGTAEAVADAEVVISSRDGLRTRVSTDEEGRFVAEEIESGVYAIAVWRNRLLAACALHVVDDAHDPANQYSDSVLLTIASLDRTTVKTSIIRYLPPTLETASSVLDGVNFEALASKVHSHGSMSRIAQHQGGLTGRVYLAGAKGSDLQGAASSNIFIYKDGLQIARNLTNELGEFEIEKLSPGVYSLLAIGPGGIGLIGFELTPETDRTTASLPANSQQLVSQIDDVAADNLALQLAPVADANETMEVLMEEEVIEIVDGIPYEIELADGCCIETACDVCCLPMGGTSVGGGGGGGGGGGLGGLGALIGIAAVVAIPDDDDEVLLPPVASPVNP